jgi:signal transduction histidine kinase
MEKEEELLISELPFTVAARTARLIGQENFANAEGAVIELVKNSYDADATICFIIIDPLNDRLYIFDNGDGMEETIIVKHWMTIGTDDKKTNHTSNAKRVRTGAKGIGRFALDRLGKSSRMVTKISALEKLVWNVDWEQFDQTGAVIQDIKARLSKSGTSFFDEIDTIQNATGVKNIQSSSAPGDIVNDGAKLPKVESRAIRDFWKEEKGTLIAISNLRDEWDTAAITSLYSNLEILVPPIETNIFQVYLFSTLDLDKYGMVQPTICDDYDYKLTASVKEDKSTSIEIFRNELNVNELKRIGFFEKSNLPIPRYGEKIFEEGSFKIESTLTQLVAGFKAVDKNNNLDKIGPFSFTFYFMKRGGGEKGEEETRYPYKKGNYRDRARWLDIFGGLKIYRDNFRVRPYGEVKGNSFDWLDLGSRSASSPAVTKSGYRVRPNQVYGVINISRVGNINFDDKSGREGIQENDTFSLFKELLTSLIQAFENDRNQIMIALKKISDERNKKQKAQAEADAIIEKKKKESKTQSGPTTGEESNTLINAIEAYKEEIEDLKDEQKLLRVLASAGLIVTSFAHELKNLSDSIVPRTEDLKQLLKTFIDELALKTVPDYLNPYVLINDMRTQDERLKTWLDFSLASVRKDKRSRRTINMVSYIEGLERMWNSLLARRKVSLTIDKWKWEQVNFRGHEIDLDGIFNNLIANSVDAFKRKDASDQRHIKISFSYNPNDPKGLGIGVVYEDSGPGLELEILDPTEIFQPFFTTKRDERTGEKIGTGLGMWIVKSVIDEYGGDITFLTTRPGFKLKLILPHH